ncbi:MAG: Uma2 family endonuclease [Acidobacteria bacterium]|nr:Uma2 family endonuclease [Acidobacteriota bacterium]
MTRMTLEIQHALFNAKTCTSLPEIGNVEILNGTASAVPAADTKHQRIAIKLTAFLYEKLEQKNRGIVMSAPSRVMLSSRDIVKPDIFFVRKNREGILGEQIILGPPDIVVEITSNDTWERDMYEKRKIYSDAGILEYWIVDPEAETVEQLVWSELGYISIRMDRKCNILSSAFFTDLEIPVSEVFAHR